MDLLVYLDENNIDYSVNEKYLQKGSAMLSLAQSLTKRNKS